MQKRAPASMKLGPRKPDFRIPRGWRIVADTFPETRDPVVSIAFLQEPIGDERPSVEELIRSCVHARTPAGLSILRKVLKNRNKIPDSWEPENPIFAGTLLEDETGRRYVAQLVTVVTWRRRYLVEWLPLDRRVAHHQGFAVIKEPAPGDARAKTRP